MWRKVVIAILGLAGVAGVTVCSYSVFRQHPSDGASPYERQSETINRQEFGTSEDDAQSLPTTDTLVMCDGDESSLFASDKFRTPKQVDPAQSSGAAIEDAEPFRFLGTGISREQTYNEVNERRVAAGLAPIEMPPHLPQLHQFYALLEKHGFAREELYEPYSNDMKELIIFFDPDFPTTPMASEVARFSDASDWASVNEIIEIRLKDDPSDIPALLLQFDLHATKVMVDAMFADAELLVPAIADIEPKGFDKRSLLYYLMNSLETCAYADEGWLERRRNLSDHSRNEGGRFRVGYALFYLHRLELEGLW